MMGKNKNVPKIRFKGFAEEWEEKVMGRIGSTFTGLSGKTKDDFGHGDAEFVTYMNVFSNPIAKRWGTERVEIDSKQNEVKYGDVLFTTSSETPEEVGMSSIWLSQDRNVYLNSFCFGYRSDKTSDSYYLAYLLRSPAIRKKFVFLAQGISRYNISKNKVMEIGLPFPIPEEQTLIGNYFQSVDKLIEASQCKLDKLKNIKKGCLEKMFPKHGATTPEIRFKGFTADWERRKFSELYKKVSEKNDLSYGVDKIISVANMYFKTDTHISDKDYLMTYNIFKLGDIAFEGNRSKNFMYGRFVENTIGDGIVSHVFDVFRPIMDFDLQFWKYAINNERLMRSILMRCTKSSTMMTNLVAVDFLNESFYVPCIEEQREIGLFLSNIDSQINRSELLLEKLKNIKKACLARMFINKEAAV